MSKINSIKTRVITISISMVVIILIVLITIINTVGKNNLTELENKLAETNIKRAYAAYDYVVNNYEKKIADWGVWDDTYDFIKDLNKDYIDSNLGEETLTNLHIDELIFFDRQGALKYSTASTKVLGLEPDFPEDMEDFLIKNRDIYNHLQKKKVFSSLTRTENGTLMYTIHQILKSEGLGDHNGYIFFGRYVDNWLAKDLSLILQIPVSIYSDYQENDQTKTDQYKNYNNKISKNRMFSTFSTPVDKNGSIIFNFETNLELLSIVSKNAKIFILIIFCLLTMAIITNYLLIKRSVLDEVYKVNSDLDEVSSAIQKKRIDEEARTIEFTQLRKVINMLIDSTNISKKELEEKILQSNKLNNLMSGRELKMHELKEEINNIKKRLI
jgi:sensor domain CHASE-containing protein